MKKVGFEPTWGKLTDLQSVAFDHSAISPYFKANTSSTSVSSTYITVYILMYRNRRYRPPPPYAFLSRMMKYSKLSLVKFLSILLSPILIHASIDGASAQCCYFLSDFTDTYAFWIISFFLVLTCLTLANYKNHLYATKESLLNSSNSTKTQFSSTKTRLETKLLYRKTIQYVWLKFKS